jgi:site-specific DNA-methyltransferase (adenine-specific)
MPAILHGDCIELLPALTQRFDAVITDPPYGLQFMAKAWDTEHVAFDPHTWRLIAGTLKPGAHLAVFGGTRTHHRLMCAIEDAGLEIRDTLCWLYGSGFPKSHDISKAIDKAAGAEREVIGPRLLPNGKEHHFNIGFGEGEGYDSAKAGRYETAPATPEAARWQGWGTALKPAFEPIILARKPLVGTVAANVLAHGTGAINIDACRISAADGYTENRVTQGINTAQTSYAPAGVRRTFEPSAAGRWPANVLHDGSDEVEAAFAAFGESKSTSRPRHNTGARQSEYGMAAATIRGAADDAGTASRFFYCAKASKADRAGSKHPTVKPVALLQWLTRLLTQPGDHILDPFAGSGTLVDAAYKEQRHCTVIERDAQYIQDIHNRIGRAIQANLAV